MITNAKIIAKDANPDDYHKQTAGRGTPEHVMSASALRNFSTCPARYLNGYEPPESDAKDYGALLDCAVLTPGQFTARYIVEPATYRSDKDGDKPWNNNATVCREWHKDQEAAGRTVVKAKELAEIHEAGSRLMHDETIAAYFDASERQVWMAAEWHDAETGLVVPIKTLVDLRPRKDTEFAGTLGDLKTTRNAALLPWQRWCFQAGYHIQAALYLDMEIAVTGEDRNTFCFILQENYPPYMTAKRMLSQDFTELGRAEYRRLLANYCQCLKHGHWPDYDETDESAQGWSLVHAEAFMAERAAFSPKFEFGVEPEPTEQATDDVPS